MVIFSETALLRSGKPADFSCYHLKKLDVDEFFSQVGLLAVRNSRVGAKPTRGQTRKFLTRAIWFNNNNLRNITNMDTLVAEILEYPKQLGWIDFSFNKIQRIDECILKFKDLKIIYFHGNCISDFDEIEKLKPLTKLRSITFHGNPVANHPYYRNFIIMTLPQVVNLDFTPILPREKLQPKIPELMKRERKNSK